ILAGGNAAFIVQVTPPEARFQWYKNGVVITNATNSLLVITGVTFADVGLYSCTASASPSVGSREASLAVVGAASTGGGITTVPVSYPYPGSGTSVSGPCGNYIGMVKYPRPGGTSLNYSWIPEPGATNVRFYGTTTSIPGMVSTASVLQGYPPRRTCSYGLSSTTASVGNSSYQFTMYVSAPTSLPKGTPINATIEWQR
ncbi:MAG: immunoglobulin domain-containing protein, partial [Verrucomicrobiales bacterium]|nr:immunoglobulin domain-containing protein [Verrucomicrobiales bacterium]